LHEAGAEDLKLTNTDFDTGRLTHAGEYPLTDKTYAHLLDQLAEHNFDQVTPELRDNLLAFYADPNAPVATKKKPKDWQRTMDELERLKSLSITAKPNTPETSLDSPDQLPSGTAGARTFPLAQHLGRRVAQAKPARSRKMDDSPG